MVHVHGHAQCGRCGVTVQPCCAGASALDEADEPEAGQVVDAHLFPRLFDELGGRHRTVTRQALLFVLQRWLGSTLDDANDVLAAGLHVGHLREQDGLLRLGEAAPE